MASPLPAFATHSHLELLLAGGGGKTSGFEFGQTPPLSETQISKGITAKAKAKAKSYAQQLQAAGAELRQPGPGWLGPLRELWLGWQSLSLQLLRTKNN
ncbi:MAG: hypothetical protein E6Q97_35930 [Desulfurellales bacterium]|nr:MAG: hypothetical protein E6Q97_35930 [Desulfurellales bacterium]